MEIHRRKLLATAAAAALLPPATALSQRQQRGRGPHGRGRGPQGKGTGRDRGAAHAADQSLIHTLLANRDSITRDVKMLPNGVETLTETDDARLRGVLLAHVRSMAARVEHRAPIHMRDPLFAEIFRNAEKIKLALRPTERGVHVVETSDDEYVVRLIQRHAEAVSAFLKNGPAEVRRNHEPPAR